MEPGQRPRRAVDVDAIKRRVTITDAVQAFVPGIRWRRQGQELFALSPFKAERTPSFSVNPKKGTYYDFAAGHGGDAIRFVQQLLGIDFQAAVTRLAEHCIGQVPMQDADPEFARRTAADRARFQREDAANEVADRQARMVSAAEIWAATLPAEGTIVETYMAARGIDLDVLARVYGWRIPASLRFHPRLLAPGHSGHHWGPAMVGLITDATGAPIGIHRTFLAPDGQGKARIPNAKLALGTVMGGMGVLSWKSDGASDAGHLVIGEGYETTLTVMVALARRGVAVGGVSALTLGNLAGAGLGQGRPHPVTKGRRVPSDKPDPQRPGLVLPAGIKRITILEDADGSDRVSIVAMYARAIAKFRARGIRVRIATPALGSDFNDMAGAIAV